MKIVATFELPDDELTEGWNGRLDEVAASVSARLEQVYDDNGGEQLPQAVTVFVECRGRVGLHTFDGVAV